jgi:predicted DCC family thiol-disulfide oxidoreductase YuxK
MKTLDHKLIIYDGNCKLCSSWKDVVLKFTAIPDEKVMAFGELTGDLSTHIDPEKFRNVMALIDTTGGETIYGAEGVAYIFSSQYRMANALFRFAFAREAFDFFYKTQAYNRYIIATPRSQFICDCLPDRVVKYRISYIVLVVLLSVLLTAWLGTTLKPLFPGSSLRAAEAMLLIAGTGWILQIGLAAAFLKEKALDYIGHLGSIMVAGLLVLVPWMLLYAITGWFILYVPVVSVAISSSVMLWLHVQRARYLEISQRWTTFWFFLLQSSALFWIYVIFIM